MTNERRSVWLEQREHETVIYKVAEEAGKILKKSVATESQGRV